MSRQTEYQARMRAEGRCQICGKPEANAKGYCEKHRRARLARVRKPTGEASSCSNCGKTGHNRRTCSELKGT